MIAHVLTRGRWWNSRALLEARTALERCEVLARPGLVPRERGLATLVLLDLLSTKGHDDPSPFLLKVLARSFGRPFVAWVAAGHRFPPRAVRLAASLAASYLVRFEEGSS